MSSAQIEIILVAVVVAASCSLIGTFLVLRKMALMSDAISHAVLLGIVVMFFFVRSTASVPMVLAATATGVLTVYLVELLVGTRLVKEDAAIGLVFPALFSIGVILISRHAANIHLDIDVVLLGELAFVPFDRLTIAGLDLGPKSLWLGLSVGIINLIFVLLFYKELKLATFDPSLAAALGFSPTLIHYALMTLVSVTAVSSFEVVGSVLVVGLMIAPPASAYLLTDRLPVMLGLGVLIAAGSAGLGYATAYLFDSSISGSMATVAGLILAVTVLVAPERGLISRWLRRRRQRIRFAAETLIVHLVNHADALEVAGKHPVGQLKKQLKWREPFTQEVLHFAGQQKWLVERNGRLHLTSAGSSVAARVTER